MVRSNKDIIEGAVARYRRGGEDAYDTAQICEIGHVITEMLGKHPEEGAKFCAECGAATLVPSTTG